MNYFKKISLVLASVSALVFTSCDLINGIINPAGQQTVVQIADVVFSPAGGTAVEKGDTVTLSCETSGTDIYYAINKPFDKDSYEFLAEKGTSVTINEDCTVYALATDGNGNFSNVTSAGFSIKSSGGDNPGGGESGGGSGQETGDDSNLGEETVVVINSSNSDKSLEITTSEYTTGSNKTATKLDSVTAPDGTIVKFNCNKGTKPTYTSSQFRFYAGTDIEFITPADKTLVKVEFTFATQTSKGESTLKSGPISPNRGEYDGDYFIWTGRATPSAHLKFSPEQATWIKEIKITYKAGIGTPSEEIPPFEPAKLTDYMSGSLKNYKVTYTGEAYTTVIDSSALTTTGLADNHELLLGNPTGAKPDAACKSNYLLVEEIGKYSVSYNDDTHNPNWVSWHLAKADLWNGDKTIVRQDDFRANPKLPDGYYRVTANDYGGSGFDQGHMLNSYDRLSSNAINSETFYMTNMVPQSGTCNRGTWKGLEDWEQTQAESGKELYIVCGPYGQGGDTQKNGVAKLFESTEIVSKTDSSVKIIVPRYVWKILVVLPEGEDDLNRIDASTTVVAAILPNSTCVKGTEWMNYVCTVDYIEELTGYDFFANLPDDIEDAIEAKKYTSN